MFYYLQAWTIPLGESQKSFSQQFLHYATVTSKHWRSSIIVIGGLQDPYFFLFSQNNPSRSESSMGQNKLKHSFFPLHYDAEINIHLPIQNQLYHCKFPHPRVRFLKGCKLTLLSVVGQCPHSGSQSSLRKIYNLCSVGFWLKKTVKRNPHKWRNKKG